MNSELGRIIIGRCSLGKRARPGEAIAKQSVGRVGGKESPRVGRVRRTTAPTGPCNLSEVATRSDLGVSTKDNELAWREWKGMPPYRSCAPGVRTRERLDLKLRAVLPPWAQLERHGGHPRKGRRASWEGALILRCFRGNLNGNFGEFFRREEALDF